MNLTTALRLAIVIQLVSIIAIFIVPDPSHPLLQEYLTQQDSFSLFSENTSLTYLLISLLWLLIIVPSIGLFLGNHWAKSAFIAALIISNFLWFFVHEPTVESNTASIIGYIQGVAEGFILALLLFTEVPLDKRNKWLSIIGFTVLCSALFASILIFIIRI